ncbi:hypothetical protein V492_07190 [Pseudogymnoascus sp. VKM F-4246]|nr:hypothetical protein V492_07190 [Pseudogymnoascus sp. VKM F-4246]
MALIKFLITAFAAALMITSALAGPVPALAAVARTPDTTANHLEKRVCNEYGCGMKCKGTVHTPCSRNVHDFSDCRICSYFKYAADGTPTLTWDAECLFIQWDMMPPHDKC